MNLSSRVFPQSLEAERAVLGACLLSNEALGTSIEILNRDDFYDDNNRVIFDTLTSTYLADNPVDLITVSEELKKKNLLERIGGKSYLESLLENITLTENVIYHANIVKETSQRRKLIEAGHKLTELASDSSKSNPEVISEAEKLLLKTADDDKNSEKLAALSDILGQNMYELEAKKEGTYGITGFTTAFPDLDNLTGGLQPGSLNIIAARPSMGKTSLALNIAQFGGGRDQRPVLIFSLEMPASQLGLRMLAAESGIGLSNLINGSISAKDFKAVKDTAEQLRKRPVFISDNSSLSTTDLLIKARRFKTKHPDLALILVDYLQLMTAGRKTESRQLEVAEISRSLKAVARELSVPVLALSQLSRAAETRTDKKPQLSDLRDSGAIEQDADLVMMLYREDYYGDNENSDLTDSKADLRIAKNRNGATGVVHLTFRREITRFLNFGEE